MKNRFNRTLLTAFTSAFLALALTACQVSPVNDKEAKSSVATSSAPLLPPGMTTTLLQTEAMRTLAANRQTLLVSYVYNETPQYIDTHLMTEEILRDLIHAGITYELIRRAPSAEKPAALLLEAVVTGGTQGEVGSQDLQAVHLITLRLTDGENTYWSATQPLPKRR